MRVLQCAGCAERLDGQGEAAQAPQDAERCSNQASVAEWSLRAQGTLRAVARCVRCD